MPAIRCAINPIITPASGAIGDNINGATVIRVPPWIKQPLGRYYMYFAHHQGDSIRLATADDPAGPWTVRPERPLRLDQLAPLGFTGHVASPDILIDERGRRILLFFHAPKPGWRLGDTPSLRTHFTQATGLATSVDGLRFAAVDGPVLGFPYFRVFKHGRRCYALSARGLLFRAPGDGIPDGRTAWEEREEPLGSWRHCSVLVRDGRLLAIYTRTGDEPERILMAEAALGDDWRTWRLAGEREVLRPEMPWEGANLPLSRSRKGAVAGREHALRDPFIFRDDAGAAWLYYSVAGESGIAVARFALPEQP